MASVVKDPPANAGDSRDVNSVPDPGFKPRAPAVQGDSLPSEPHRNLSLNLGFILYYFVSL